MPGFQPSRAAFYLLFTVSGFAGLIYESIWTHYLKLFLGHAAYAQSLVLVVFMGGMAAGSAYCGRISTRLRNPLHADGREYLLLAGMSGAIAAGRRDQALALWERHAANLSGAAGQPAFRLLRCHAQTGAGDACAAAFRAHAED